jgi:winged helix DNA-binding protein
MRATIHLVSARDYWPFALAVRRRRGESWLRVHREAPSSHERNAAVRRLRARLTAGPMRRAEIQQLLGEGSAWTNGIGLWLDMVRVPPSGTWERRRADLYAAAADWLGPGEGTPEEGLERLVRRYLGGFGPATPADIADWTGVPAGDLKEALEGVRLRRFSGEGGEELVDLPRAPLPDPHTPAPVRFLPVWDATLLVHARRTGILPDRYRSLVFDTKTPHSVQTFLVDGAVAGTWRYEGGRVRFELFEPLDQATRRDLANEATRLAALHA